MRLVFLFMCLLGIAGNNSASAGDQSVRAGTPAGAPSLQVQGDVPIPSKSEPGDEGVPSDVVEDLMELDLGPISPLSDNFDSSLLSIIEDLENPAAEEPAGTRPKAEVRQPIKSPSPMVIAQLEKAAVPSMSSTRNKISDGIPEVSFLVRRSENRDEFPVVNTPMRWIESSSGIPVVTAPMRQIESSSRVPVVTVPIRQSENNNELQVATLRRKSNFSLSKSASTLSQLSNSSPVAPKRAFLESNPHDAAWKQNPAALVPAKQPIFDRAYELYSPKGNSLNRVVNLSQLKASPMQFLPPFQFITPNKNAQSFVGMSLIHSTEKKMIKYPYAYAILQPVPLSFQVRSRRPNMPVPAQDPAPVQVHPIPINMADLENMPVFRQPNPIQKRSIPHSNTRNQWQPRPGHGMFSRGSVIRGPGFIVRGNTPPFPRAPYQVAQQQPQLRTVIELRSPYVRQPYVNSAYPQQQQFGQYNVNTAPQGGPPAFLPRSYGHGQNEPWITSFQPNPQFQRRTVEEAPPAPKYVQGIRYWPHTGFRQTFIAPPTRPGPSPPSPFRPRQTSHAQTEHHVFQEPVMVPWLKTYSAPSYHPQTFTPSQHRPTNQFGLQPPSRRPSYNIAQSPIQGGYPFKPSSAASAPSEPVPGNGHREVTSTRVNPYTYFRSHGPISNSNAQSNSFNVQSNPVTSVNPVPSSRDANDGTSRLKPPVKSYAPTRFQQQGATEVHKSTQTTTPSVLPEYRGPVSFYSQAEVDSHYRRVLDHNEKKKDTEFEDDNELLQWHIQRAKQVLRQRQSQNSDQSSKQKDEFGGWQQREPYFAVPRPVPGPSTGPLGSNSYPGQARTNEFSRGSSSGSGRPGYANTTATGFVFNGTTIEPNGGIRLSNEHHARHSVPRRRQVNTEEYLLNMNYNPQKK